ncbi:cytochrome-c peroxidase [Campylobacter hyointestinalis]|uniref:Cytochrome-c peroxidase n=1 Tax=Campylobacter hyointestinalis subsp. lawsonii TaxID=91353 RepID=A0AAV6EGW8_CAMHY|nr:cytochrome-c peroxidase [Campylobacter hyointestinalis]KAB0612414.1 cytochrome-c peroxidase [Campylobacter hyointestinalis subsp. lawsonii]QKF68865.1 periplasmic diheme cytochrome c peroxidase [Campylobacter hyointestinalis subsp. lawsonii]RAZ27596.1 cytochrome C biogenesis protein CcsA [Campylobacter hyointestinalis subsp. lawsonii]
MKGSVLFLSSVLVASSMFAISDADLLKEAKNAGLVALPSDQKQVDAMLKEIGVKPNKFSEAKAELGKKLYFEPRLSKSGIISCNTCHNLGLGGTDGIAAAVGHKWTANPHHLNSPTVYNSVLNTTQFWDGRAMTLVDQAKGPIEAEPEMATPAALAVERISSLPEYVAEFKKIYKDGVTFDNIADSIASFERTLLTPSRFDKFIKGDKKALTKDEKAGLKLFLDKGCVSCHTGVNLGGSMQAFEVAGKYQFANIGDFKGDANGMVKTPTLRNVTETAPYFHNGAIWSLEEAVKTMGSVQLGIEISDAEAKSIATFLNSLTGEMPKVTYPMFPRSTDKTPKPEL